MNAATKPRVPRSAPSEDPDDIAGVHEKFQAAIAQIASLYEIYSEWPGIERSYEDLAVACDNAKIADDGKWTIDDIVAEDLERIAEDAKADAAEYRAEMRADEMMWRDA